MRHTARKMIEHNAITTGYRISFLANYLMGPIYARIQTEMKLNRAEAATVFCLFHIDGLSAVEIADMTGRPRNSISPAIGKLTLNGFIRREFSSENRKIELLLLTDSGRALAHKAVAIFVEREKGLVSALGDGSDRANLDQLLLKLIFRGDDWLERMR